MKIKFFLSSIFLLILTFLFSLPCDHNLTCSGSWMSWLQYPGLWFLIEIPLATLAFTLSIEKYKFWIKLTGIFFVITMILVFISPEFDSAIFSIDKESMNWFFVGLYSFVSMVYFLVQLIKNRKMS